jgi:transposase
MPIPTIDCRHRCRMPAASSTRHGPGRAVQGPLRQGEARADARSARASWTWSGRAGDPGGAPLQRQPGRLQCRDDLRWSKANENNEPTFFARTLSKARARIEQGIGRLKRFKRVALRCEKTARNYRSIVAFAAGLCLVTVVYTT